MKGEGSTARFLYAALRRYTAIFLGASAEAAELRGPSFLLSARQRKRRAISDISTCLLQIKRHALGQRVDISLPTSRASARASSVEPIDFSQIHQDFSIAVSYSSFLTSLSEETEGRFLNVYRSVYEEVLVKKAVIVYLKKRTFKALPPSLHRCISVVATSFCLACKRPISHKMTLRHKASKAHRKEEPKYLRLTQALSNSILSRCSQYLRVFKTELKAAATDAMPHAVTKISLAPIRMKSSPASSSWWTKKHLLDIKYSCSLCDREFFGQRYFLHHFSQKPHREALKALHIHNYKDFEGITTKEGVLERSSLYFNHQPSPSPNTKLN
ncbi:hypothetical protein NEDG_00826 [Nematocida displodere]|uniref:C2H2-type domain-containing protein n=1 Tax=Nematocida displodere TaxID=1805483 RepID=A0A177ECL1_9MICR|nr:hypothetical protein NEDG_00826 [Nematocida displodere]